jgi:hypothetical protein
VASTPLAATASIAATTTRSSITSATFNTGPRAASTCPARCSSTSIPARSKLCARRHLRELIRPCNLVNQNAGAGDNWTKGHYTKLGIHSYESPCV